MEQPQATSTKTSIPEQDWNLRRLLILSLPALILGLCLRVMLTIDLPYGNIHPDSGDLLKTPDALFNRGDLTIHSKKTFLVPILYTLAFLVPKVPVLFLIPAAQHLLGLATVAIAALLCRLWFRHWQWIAPPVTLLLAANPALIWFEHSLMSEPVFVFCTALLSLAGTLYALRPERRTFIFLCIALVLEAGARPEGKLFFAFGFLLVFLTAWPRWKTALRPLGILLLVAIPAHFATLTGQAGLLLYTSLLRLAPESSKVAPGVEPYTAELRETLTAHWSAHPIYPASSQRTALYEALIRYRNDRRQPSANSQIEKLCKRLSIEVFMKNPGAIPALALHKWRDTACRSPSEDFNERNLETKQDRAIRNGKELIQRNARALIGHPMADIAEVDAFFSSRNPAAKAAWLNRWNGQWYGTISAWRTPDTLYPDGFVERGIPLYMPLAFCGMTVLAFRRLRPFHISWGLALAGLFLVILVTANVRPRFRLFFEPYWLLGCAAVLDTAAVLALRSSPRK